MKPQVVVTNVIHEVGMEQLSQQCEVLRLWETPDESSWRGRVSAMVVRGFDVDSAALDSMPNLRVVVKHGAGVDNIDIPAATERGIAVASTPGVGAMAVAEHAVGLALATVKQLRSLHSAVESGHFDIRDSARTVELSGKVLGLVGCGHIGRTVADICRLGFGMRVVAYDPYAQRASLAEAGIELVDELAEVLNVADVVSIHTALTEETRNLIDDKAFAAMKRSAVLVNTARGGVVSEEALVRALDAGEIAGAGLDVFQDEPVHGDSPLFGRPDLVLTPHMGGLTLDAFERLSRACADAVLAILEDRDPANLLNPEFRDHVTGDRQSPARARD